MQDSTCVNCGAPAVETYELLLRSNSHKQVRLCDECHEAIQREIAESN